MDPEYDMMADPWLYEMLYGPGAAYDPAGGNAPPGYIDQNRPSTQSSQSQGYGYNTSQSMGQSGGENMGQSGGQNYGQSYGESAGSSVGHGESQSDTRITPGMMEVYSQLLGMNEGNYQNVLDAYTGGQDRLQGQLPGVYGGYAGLSGDVGNTLGMGQVLGQNGNWGVAAPAAQAIAQAAQQARGSTTQQMINAGLGNTTVLANAQNQNSLREGQAYAGLGAQLAKEYADKQSQIGLAGQGAQLQGAQLQAALAQAMGGSLAGYRYGNTAGDLTGQSSQSVNDSSSQQQSQNAAENAGWNAAQNYGWNQAQNQSQSQGEHWNQSQSTGQGGVQITMNPYFNSGGQSGGNTPPTIPGGGTNPYGGPPRPGQMPTNQQPGGPYIGGPTQVPPGGFNGGVPGNQQQGGQGMWLGGIYYPWHTLPPNMQPPVQDDFNWEGLPGEDDPIWGPPPGGFEEVEPGGPHEVLPTQQTGNQQYQYGSGGPVGGAVGGALGGPYTSPFYGGPPQGNIPGAVGGGLGSVQSGGLVYGTDPRFQGYPSRPTGADTFIT